MSLLAEDALGSVTVVLAGSDWLAGGLRGVGARVEVLAGEPAESWATERMPIDVLVFDAAPAFGAGGPDGLRRALDDCWSAIHLVVAGGLIPAQRAGTAILLGPPAGAGPHAEAARAGLENLARTLSVEWARYSITTTMIAPGQTTSADELAAVVAFLASRAGDYVSGARIELGSV